MLPLFLVPETLVGRLIVAKVDNLACVYGFENSQMKNDEAASILIRTLRLITAYTVLHLEHLHRRSSWEAVADNMSRKSTTSFIEHRALSRFPNSGLPQALTDWFREPRNNWDLPRMLLEHVKARVAL
jgi:hypothetical protein